MIFVFYQRHLMKTRTLARAPPMLYASISAAFGTLPLLPLARPNKQSNAVEVRKMINNNNNKLQQRSENNGPLWNDFNEN